jgi:hypothetical protein
MERTKHWMQRLQAAKANTDAPSVDSVTTVPLDAEL